MSSPGSSALTIHNSIVAGSRGLDGEPIEDVRTTGDAPQVTHSLIENLGSVTPEEITGISNLLNVDPMLGTLADNGGPTRTHALLPSSLAIDAAGLTSHAFDQRGFPRVVDLPSLPNGPHGAADIGAFELQAEPVAAVFPPGKVEVSAGTFAETDLSRFLLYRPVGETVTVELTAQRGTFREPVDGSTVGAGVAAVLDGTQAITLTGSAADINLYLDNPSNLGFRAADGDVGFGVDAIEVEVDAIASGEIAVDVSEFPSLIVSGTHDTIDRFDGVISLREAVRNANAMPGPDAITFDPAVFTGGTASFIRLTAGELRVTESLTIDASSGVDVIVSGDAAGDDAVDLEGITNPFATFSGTTGFAPDRLKDNSRLFNFESEPGETSEGNLTLERITLTGGAADLGGGIRFVSAGSLELNHAAVSGNWAEFGGGGIQIVTGSALLRDSVVSQNWTTGIDAPGGGIASPDENGTVAFIDSRVSGNRTGKVFANRLVGRNAYGGWIYAANLLLERSLVEGNDAGAADDGGVWAGNLTMRQSTVHNNRAFRSGAGIYADEAVIESSTISGNRTGFSPGGIYIASSLVLNDSTVTDNETGTGGGIYFADSAGTQAIDIHNSIVAGNRDRNAADGNVVDLWSGTGVIPTVTHSLIGNTTGSNIDSSTGTGNLLNVDPLLEPLADNGGPTLTHAMASRARHSMRACPT